MHVHAVCRVAARAPVLSVARSTLGYQSRLVDRDAPALAAMRRRAAQYPRYGYRRIRNFS